MEHTVKDKRGVGKQREEREKREKNRRKRDINCGEKDGESEESAVNRYRTSGIKGVTHHSSSLSYDRIYCTIYSKYIWDRFYCIHASLEDFCSPKSPTQA